MPFITYRIVFNNELNEETVTRAITVCFSVVCRIAYVVYSKEHAKQIDTPVNCSVNTRMA